MTRRLLTPLALLAVLLAAPAAQAAGRCGDVSARPWCNTSLSPDARAELLLGALTRDEKIGLLAGDELTGVRGAEGSHTGTSNGVERVGLPPIYFSDGPVGTRQGKATGMPSSMSLAASFDRRLAARHASIVGDEVKRKGNDVVYAPAMNMLRTPLNGRTFEYFGEDPFLAGQMAAYWTKGVQGAGVMANAKHFAVNNQEGIGGSVPGAPVGGAVVGSRMSIDAQVDERTLREIYLPQFEAAVKQGGAASVMCAYPRVNGQYACENDHLLNDVLKGDWNFPGFVLTDYGANHSTANSLNNGLDLDIWPAVFLQPPLVTAALTTGQVSQATIDEHIRRQLRTLFAFGFFDRDAYADDTASIDQDAHHAAAGEIEAQGTVLLKNAGGLLPLKPGKVAVIGPEADAIRNGGGSSAINSFKLTTPLQALRAKLGEANVAYDDGSDAARAAAVAKIADTAIVVVGDRMTEGRDKSCMTLTCDQPDRIDREALIEAVAAANPRTVVVLQSGGPVVTPWRGKVPAILEAWYPGDNGGSAIASVLYGDTEPGGRLPGTFPVSEADTPTAGDPEKYPGVGEVVKYKEGVLIGYRWYDEQRKDVAFPFGYGLTYTRFDYSSLRLDAASEDRVRLSAVVRNTGRRSGTAVPQLYVNMPEPAGLQQPPWQLKGFRKVTLAPGKAKRVGFTLDKRAFSHWAGSGWEVTPGCYTIGVGAHSRSLRLQGVLARGARCAGALTVGGRAERKCLSRRNFTIHLRKKVRSARVVVHGKRVRTVRRKGRLTARVNLRGFKPGRFTVKISGRLKSGKRFKAERAYRTCVYGR